LRISHDIPGRDIGHFTSSLLRWLDEEIRLISRSSQVTMARFDRPFAPPSRRRYVLINSVNNILKFRKTKIPKLDNNRGILLLIDDIGSRRIILLDTAIETDDKNNDSYSYYSALSFIRFYLFFLVYMFLYC
jgi:hypothetical protein